ncbi:MAG: 50S ribosomal protein L19 [Chitinophagaceae bacterium]
MNWNVIAYVHEQLTTKKNRPSFLAGDNVTVNYKISEGGKERIQSFKGDVIKRQGIGNTATFTVRKISDGIGVERLFPLYSPNVDSIVVNKRGDVRRAKLYYMRQRSGKNARIQEKRMTTQNVKKNIAPPTNNIPQNIENNTSSIDTSSSTTIV